MTPSTLRALLRVIALGLPLAVFVACSDDAGSILESPSRASTLEDSVAPRPSNAVAMANGGIVLPETASLQITLVERNASFWHALYVAEPQDTLLAGPGYLFPGPWFAVGPYPAGPVVLRLEAYDSREPHAFLGTALQQVTGSYPAWTVAFEDAGDNDFDDIIVTVEAVSASLSLSCAPPIVERGQHVMCSIKSPVDDVLGWQWVGYHSYGLVPDTISVLSSDTTWSGIAVHSGTVSAFVVANGATDTLTGQLTVIDRSWTWGPDQWSFLPDGGQLCSYVPLVAPADSITLGRNTRRSDCSPGVIDPNVRHGDEATDSGYVAELVQGGPNDGFWYVAAALWRMDRGSSINPFITPEGPADTLRDNHDINLCRRALGLPRGAPVVVNFYTYNTVCRGRDLGPMLAGIRRHEEYGTNPMTAPDGHGHQQRNEYAAADVLNDPYEFIEGFVTPSRDTLRIIITNRVGGIDSIITEFGVDHNFVKNNWCGDEAWAWVFWTDSEAYSQTTIRQTGGNCI